MIVQEHSGRDYSKYRIIDIQVESEKHEGLRRPFLKNL